MSPNMSPQPFGQADTLQLQRLQQADAQAKKALDDGEIDDAAYGQLAQQIQGRLQPLLARQQQAQQAAQAQQAQQVAQQHAQMQAMEQQAAVFRAKGLQERIVPILDPLTGRIARLYESSPGKWEEIKFEGHPEPVQPEAPVKEPS